MNKNDVWGDLMYALDELERPSLGTYDRIPDIFLNSAYHKAEMRAKAKNAHEAIEKGLKAILLDSGWTLKTIHELDQLLGDVQQYNPTAFNELERCFNSAIQYLESVTSKQYVSSWYNNMGIIAYFQKHGTKEIFLDNRYESIDGIKNPDRGMIGWIYREIVRALLSLIFGRTPKDVNSRIEEEARKARTQRRAGLK